MSANTYAYDCNGNQTTRTVGGETYDLAYDAEGHLVTVTKGGNTVASFTYDGDGKRVKAVEGSETILFVGAHFEINTTTSEVTKYYMAGATRVAVRKYTVPSSSELTYLLGDHLGSTSLATDENGALLVETRYKAWGEVRYTTENSTLPTRYSYTGQYSYISDSATDLGNLGFGLMYYGARFYDPALGRFSSADTLIPEQTQGTQAWDRYAYANNNPLFFVDPTGHDGVPWGDIIKFLVGQLVQNRKITDSDWRTAANTYMPATHKGSNAALVASVVSAPAAVTGELNAVTTSTGDFEAYITLGGGGGLGEGVAAGVTQGGIDGSGFNNAIDFAGDAGQVSVGGNLPVVPIGMTADFWGGMENGEGNNIYGWDIGPTVGVPGVSVTATFQRAIPLFGFKINSGFGLFVCRAMAQCGRPITKDFDIRTTDEPDYYNEPQ